MIASVITAVEGTRATLTFRLNKPVAQASLLPGQRPQKREGDANPTTNPAAAGPVALVPDPTDPSVYSVAFDMKESQRYRLQLVDDQGRGSKQTAELVVNVTANRPPDVKL